MPGTDLRHVFHAAPDAASMQDDALRGFPNPAHRHANIGRFDYPVRVASLNKDIKRSAGLCSEYGLKSAARTSWRRLSR